MAPQTDEFGTKVGAARRARRRVRRPPDPRPAAAGAALRVGRDRPVRATGRARRATRAWCAGIARVGLTLGAGARARRRASWRPARRRAGAVAVNCDEILDRVPHQVDPSTFPAITVGQDVTDFDHTMVGAGAQEVVQTMAENLELENQALLRRDGTILTAVDHGDRLDRDAGPPRRRDRERHHDDRPLRLRHRRHVAAQAVRQADRPQHRHRVEGHDDRGDLRRRRQAARPAARCRSTRCSSSAARPAVAGSTSRCCRRRPGAEPATGPRTRLPVRRPSSIDCHLGALDPRLDLRERRVARRRGVVAERREAAVVGRAEVRRVDELAPPRARGRGPPRPSRSRGSIGSITPTKIRRLPVACSPRIFEHALAVRLARELDVEVVRRSCGTGSAAASA